jgi:uracil-DNA glycosylase
MAEARSREVLEAIYRDCQRCDLAQSRSRLVFGYGRAQAPLLCLAERISGVDEQAGHPFAGPAGELVARILAAPDVEIPAADVYLTNLVLCRGPGDRSPRASEIRACQARLRQEIQCVGPRLLVILGRLPMQHFLGQKGGVGRHRGWHTWPHNGVNLPSYVTLNPASALYGEPYDIRRKKLLIYTDWQDIAKAYRALPAAARHAG